jgi:DNA-binding response OmpR family regulator
MAKILLVDDDKELVSMLQSWLLGEHHIVESIHDGIEASQQLRVASYDVIVLDWDLPGMSGMEICKQFRSQNGTTPIIMLTGKSAISEKEVGLDAGADDYLTKPFNVKELSARLRALLRRPQQIVAETLKVGEIELDAAKYKVLKSGKQIHLVPKDFALLEFLMRHPDQVFSADALLQRVWQSESEATSEAIRTSIKRIRQKLDDGDDVSQSIIENIPKVGYRLRPSS